MREISQNCMYQILTSSKRCYDQVECYARQVFKSEARAMIEVYKKICEEQPYGFLVVDVHPKTPHFAKLRTQIFRDQQPQIIFVPKQCKLKP